MRSALIFTAIVLACAAASLYQLAWRHGEGIMDGRPSDRALPAAPETVSGLESSAAAAAEERQAGTRRRARADTPSPERASEERWYQYVDANGSIRFAQSLGEVPPKLRARALRMEMSVPIQKASVPAPRRARARRAAPADAEQVWGGTSSEVIIYTARWCGACHRAMAHLDEAGVDYVNKDIEDDPDAEEEYLEKSGGRRGIPLIDVGGQIMQGYSRRGLDRLLAKLG